MPNEQAGQTIEHELKRNARHTTNADKGTGFQPAAPAAGATRRAL